MAEPLILKNGSNITNNVTVTSGFGTSHNSVVGLGTTVSVGIGTTIPTSSRLAVVGGDIEIQDGKLGIGTDSISTPLTVVGNSNITGIVTASNGFISAASTTAVKITVESNKLIFTAAGIGSTSFTLS